MTIVKITNGPIVRVTERPVIVNLGKSGVQGPVGATGVVSATSPVTYSSDTKTVALTTNTAGGVPILDSSGLLLTSQLPALSISNTSVVGSQAAMLGLTAEAGDIAVRTDVSKSYILTASPASTIGNWQELLTPPDTVTSVNSQTGNVVLTATSVGAAATSHTHTLSQVTDAGTAASKNIASTGDATSTQVVAGNDTRLTDARTPSAHKTSHATGGTDALTATDIGAAATAHTHVATGDVTGTLGASSAALTIATGSVTSAKILDGTILNADVNASAAIDDTKLSLASTASGQLVNATGGYTTNKMKDLWSDSFAHARSSQCSTMPRILSNASLTMVSGTIYAVRCVYTGAQASHQFTGMRWFFASITSTVFSQLRGAVYDSTGALIANGYTADYSASASASTLATPALNATITLTPGAVYYLGVAAVFTGTAPTIRGTTVSASMAAATPLTSRSVTGYTTGIPGTVTNATANHPWIELT